MEEKQGLCTETKVIKFTPRKQQSVTQAERSPGHASMLACRTVRQRLLIKPPSCRIVLQKLRKSPVRIFKETKVTASGLSVLDRAATVSLRVDIPAHGF